jgi:protocatechuate 3,4-dioxygenase beta subunit
VEPTRPTTDRRRFLAGGAALVGAVLVGCSDDDEPAEPSGSADGAGDAPGERDDTTATTGAGPGAAPLTAADFDALAPCLLTPEQTEGPFYLAGDMVRRDITDGQPGHPLRLGLRVLDEACAPLPGARVDVWHADVGGDYSGYADGSGPDDAGEGTTFLRGTQVAGDDGIVEFATVYPGWYPGRAVHIHVKVHLDAATVLTSQLYFPEALTDTVHAQDPYAARGRRTTRIEDDAIAGDPGAAGNLVVASPAGEGTVALVVLGVDPASA